ncbi:AraC family transcriptional regulator [Agrobacterium rosae]|uniref:AraC family transcriptional regulator n=1 Tax=Agrobacterium rosae TaxID=1972867 RepID=A0AAE5VQG5_9HYPH|nr:AraC family transcriptional regulator [Agrobacterium rosae]KAA3512891.1 AraC family transcriptional regulator [Agrobacterium rosae]KAA3521621.1 AraC family transcriptional regulator [Agrobacterium rosae]MCM2432492.1 AraC family transcriptional regulator [Agrobacterium rosae]MDX8328437.1 AraC family transcriptional regulator [Agrobacterium rosae]MQB48554.1 AraC family transcriptional regulator [Agrobacterium rosae]
MVLSQSSLFFDPLSDVLTVLNAQATRRTRFEGSGDWALSFPALDRLKFVAVLRGGGWLLLPGISPQRIETGDCCLIGRTAYAIASDPALDPIDGTPLYAKGNDVVRLRGNDTVILGGGISFAPGTAAFFLDMVPALIPVSGASPEAAAITAVLSLLERESEQSAIGHEIVTAKLAEVLIIHAIRTFASASGMTSGWLGALADVRIGRAIQCFHNNIARPWTVADLAAEAGMSRAAFSLSFTRRVGLAPFAYMRNWRMTRARVALSEGHSRVFDVAASVGYTSQSAFGHAYRQTFGESPRR